MTGTNPIPAGRRRDGRPGRVAVTDIAAAVLLAEADPHVAGFVRDVLHAIGRLPHAVDLDECLRAGDFTLNQLCERLPRVPRPWVFYSVALLEDRNYLPKGAIR